MNERIVELRSTDERCAYLPSEQARMTQRLIAGCSPSTYATLLEHGWRRFGHLFFRPSCRRCTACLSLRVDVEGFERNRSMKRTWRRNRDLDVVLRRPSVSDEHLALYRRYHDAQAAHRGWPVRTVTADGYVQSFVAGAGSFGHEMLVLDGDRLLAVALTDLLPNAVSAVYCYYEPEERARALGVFTILVQIALERQRGLDHVYLGYWIDANPSMRHKARYRPHEILEGRPCDAQRPRWVAGPVSSSKRC